MTVYVELDTKAADLRSALRVGTKSAHETLDRRFSDLNLQSRNGYVTFLKAHYLALSQCYQFDGPERLLLPDDPLDEIAADLEKLHAEVPPAWTPPKPLISPWIGCVYVVAGSRLGARLLIRRVQASEDKSVSNTTGYLASQQDPAPWSKTLAYLRSDQANALDTPHVVAAANRTFDLFLAALEDVV